MLRVHCEINLMAMGMLRETRCSPHSSRKQREQLTQEAEQSHNREGPRQDSDRMDTLPATYVLRSGLHSSFPISQQSIDILAPSVN